MYCFVNDACNGSDDMASNVRDAAECRIAELWKDAVVLHLEVRSRYLLEGKNEAPAQPVCGPRFEPRTSRKRSRSCSTRLRLAMHGI